MCNNNSAVTNEVAMKYGAVYEINYKQLKSSLTSQGRQLFYIIFNIIYLSTYLL